MNRKLTILLVFCLLVLPGSAFARVYDVKLSGAAEVPANDSVATGECLASLNDAQNQLTVICQHDVSGALAAHIHRAPAGENGPVLLPFDSAASPFKGIFSVTAQDVADLMAGNLYVNVHSGDYPDGEIRGQIGPPADAGVSFSLTGDEEVPPVDSQGSGSCIGVLNPLQTMFSLACTNDLTDVTGVEIDRGITGVNGPMVFSLGAATTVFSQVTAEGLPDCPGFPGFLDDLSWGSLYVNVMSSAFPDGELRGQVPAPQTALYFPQFGNGGDTGFTSSIVLTNTSTTTEATGTLYFFDMYGQPLDVGLSGGSGVVQPGQPVSELSFTLAPLGSLTVDTDGQGDLALGSAEVVSNVALGGIVRFQIPGIGIAGFGSAVAMSRATSPVRESGGVRSALAIRNNQTWPLTVTLELLNEDGSAPAGIDPGSNIADVIIPANGRSAQFVDEYFGDLDLTGFTGSVVISAEGGSFSAIALELGNGAGLFTSLPVSPVVGP